ncbi:Atg34p [Saccharomyces eubayanus]|uniref:Atg34p n=1 Tax=Saccharomyces eubayanus TaxID=1080349 RepID=UPI0006C0D0CE|nr:ATG19-like protein [Saccharomyces eubayanus]KOG98992.1 ATG19-like protein [Saccharomyces eubayanus]
MRILVETKTFEFAVIDQYNKSTYSAANTKAKTIKSCIDKFIDQFNLYDEQHVFWQPAEKKNARLLINNNDYGQLGTILHRQVKCNIIVGEEALKKYGLTVCAPYDDFSDVAPSEIKAVESDSVTMSRKCLNAITQQLSILEESLNKTQNQEAGPSEVHGRKCVVLPDDDFELMEFFSHLKTNAQLRDVHEAYKAYEKLLRKFDGRKERVDEFLKDSTPLPEAEDAKQVTLSEAAEVDNKGPGNPNDRTLHVEVGHEDNSLHFTIYNNTTSTVPGNCTFEFSNSASEVFSVQMGPHEIGMDGRKELWHFPALPTPLIGFSVNIINIAGEIIFSGKCTDSGEAILELSPSIHTVGSFHTLQDPNNVFRVDAFSSFDESSIMSTSFSDEEDNSGVSLERAFTWEEI